MPKRRGGNHGGGRTPIPAIERLLAKAAPYGVDCLIWTGGGTRDGYGMIRVGSNHDGSSRKMAVHRLAWETIVGTLEEGQQLDHLCRNRRCINVVHLQPVSQAENMRRGKQAQRRYCANGHLFAGHNLFLRPTGARGCRRCVADASRRYKERVA